MNRKNQFETYECSVCFAENETQEHIYQCEEIWKLKKQSKKEIPKFEEILHGNIQQKVKVTRIFQENMKILEQNPSRRIFIRYVTKIYKICDKNFLYWTR